MPTTETVTVRVLLDRMADGRDRVIVDIPDARESGYAAVSIDVPSRKAVEDQLVSLRDSRLSVLFGGNGLVIRERDGGESAILRMSVKQALVTALRAISEAGEL